MFLFAIPSAANADRHLLPVGYNKHYFIYQLNQNNFFMKQFIVIICLAVAMASCNNADTKQSTSDSTGTTVKTTTDVTLPFKLDRPYRNWTTGSSENVAVAMGGLKAFVDKDFAALGGSIGDSIDVRFDYYHATLSHDSAIKMFTSQRAMYSDITITMYDYESVISADKKDEYVTMWYKQSWKNEKGVADSISVIDDCKMKNNKMVELDEKIQHFPAKK